MLLGSLWRGGGMEVAVKTLFMGLSSEIIGQKQRLCFHARVPITHRTKVYLHMTDTTQQNLRRGRQKISVVVGAVLPGLESVEVSHFKDFNVVVDTYEDKEIKMRVDASGSKTQAIFDDVFSKLVAAAQPIPGFRRVKGGKTPDIPKDVLMHMLGPSKVNKQTIKKIINSTVAEYVEKEGLKVTKDLRVVQSFEELESTFVPGKEFGFDAIIQLQETSLNKC